MTRGDRPFLPLGSINLMPSGLRNCPFFYNFPFKEIAACRPPDAYQWCPYAMENKVKLSLWVFNTVIGNDRDTTSSLPSWLSLLANSIINYVIIYFYFLFRWYILRAKAYPVFHLHLLPFWFWTSASLLVFSISPHIGGGHSLSHTNAALVHDAPSVVGVLLPPHLTVCNNIILVWRRMCSMLKMWVLV